MEKAIKIVKINIQTWYNNYVAANFEKNENLTHTQVNLHKIKQVLYFLSEKNLRTVYLICVLFLGT
jgi:hypothetical protein